MKHSLRFVQDAEGKRKASSNFLKLHLRDEAILVVIVVLKHRLWETRGKRCHYFVFAEQMPLGRGGGGGVCAQTEMVAFRRIIKINAGYVTVSLCGCVEAAT